MDTGVTGRGFDVIIIDDPLSAQDARSEAARDNVISTYEAMLASRLDNPARGAVVVVHQRLHENDLSGYLLSRGGWRHISLPLVAEATTTYQLPSGPWVRRAGEPLVPEFWPPDVIRDTRAKGAGIFAAQYQQNPSATEGDLIERRHIRTFDKLPLGAKEIVLSFDTATKTGDNSSYSVGLVIARDETRHYVINVFRARVDPVELRDAALSLIAQYRPRKILIEDASSGRRSTPCYGSGTIGPSSGRPVLATRKSDCKVCCTTSSRAGCSSRVMKYGRSISSMSGCVSP